MADKDSTDGPRERKKPSEGFGAKWRDSRSREEEELNDWINSPDGQIVLGLLGIAFLIGVAWFVLVEPFFRWIF